MKLLRRLFTLMVWAYASTFATVLSKEYLLPDPLLQSIPALLVVAIAAAALWQTYKNPFSATNWGLRLLGMMTGITLGGSTEL